MSRCDRHTDTTLVFIPDFVNGHQWACVYCLYKEIIRLRADRDAALRFTVDNLSEEAAERLSRLIRSEGK